ncbi:MAG: hypothetical protein KDJ38_19005 [Gammaproteobacteria bacterium]|nr:hypothetical protein [Gammaproteobacteria bacterium]
MKEIHGRIRLEMQADVLLRLLENGALCVSDFRCLGADSKQCVWNLCLKSCGKALRENNENCRDCSLLNTSCASATTDKAISASPGKPSEKKPSNAARLVLVD